MKVLISNNPEMLLASCPDVTVEAEYGDSVVSGNIATLAHHGPWSSNKCPCLFNNSDFSKVRDIIDITIGVSHFDLDTLGGVLAVYGTKPEYPEFWECAAFVDINGQHRLHECPKWSDSIETRLNAFWAWSESHQLFPPRDGSIADITEFFQSAANFLNSILSENPDANAIQKGQEWAEAKSTIAANSFKAVIDNRVLLRSTESAFVNHLYNHDGKIYDAVVGWNKKTGAISLSFERPGLANACEIMQTLFGKTAGGHAGIAGSPRETEYSFEMAENVAEFVAAILNK